MDAVPYRCKGEYTRTGKTKEDFAVGGIPPWLLTIMPEYGTLIQGKWSEHETFEFRHASNVGYRLFACFAKLRRGLFVIGFTASDANVIVSDDSGLDEPRRPFSASCRSKVPKEVAKVPKEVCERHHQRNGGGTPRKETSPPLPIAPEQASI
jgi:hypothetical protein